MLVALIVHAERLIVNKQIEKVHLYMLLLSQFAALVMTSEHCEQDQLPLVTDFCSFQCFQR